MQHLKNTHCLNMLAISAVFSVAISEFVEIEEQEGCIDFSAAKQTVNGRFLITIFK